TVAELSTAGSTTGGSVGSTRSPVPAMGPGRRVARASADTPATRDAGPTARAPEEEPASQEKAASQAPAAASDSSKPFSWHAVRSAAAPQIKAFLQPAKVHEDGGVVTLEYEENWRFHFDQVVARREELETLVEKVAGPGYVVDLKGPRGSVGGGRGGRGRGAKDRSDAVRTRPDEDGTPASRSAASSGSTAHQEQAKSPARTEPAPAERQDATPTRAEPTEAKPPASEPLPGQEPASLADDLPEGFWDDGASEAAPDGAVPGVDDSGGPDASGAGTGEGP